MSRLDGIAGERKSALAKELRRTGRLTGRRRLGSGPWKRVVLPLLPLAFLALVNACSGAQDALDPRGTRWDSAGVEIVEHPLPAEYHLRTYPVEYLVRVPDTLAGGVGELGSVTDADVLPDGTLAVLDAFAAEVRVFSTSGEFLRRIGRKGGGPGELSGVWTLGLLPVSGGRLALPDVVNQAIVIFDADGALQESLHWDVMEETIPQWRVLSGDTVMVLVTTEEENLLVRRTLDGVWRDTVAMRAASAEGSSSADTRTPLFTNHLLWAASADPSHLVLAELLEPRLELSNGEKLQRVIRWAPPNRELPDSEVQTLLQVVARAMGDPEGDPRTALQYFLRPRRAPAVAAVQLGPGVVLAQRVRPFGAMDRRILSTLGASGYGGPAWDAFSWSGEYRGVVDFGENVEVFRVRGDTVVGVLEDSLGVARPFLARLPREILDVGRPGR